MIMRDDENEHTASKNPRHSVAIVFSESCVGSDVLADVELSDIEKQN